LSWLLHKGVTAPIIGATKVEHVEDAVNAVELKLSDDDVKRLEEPYKRHWVAGHTWIGVYRIFSNFGSITEAFPAAFTAACMSFSPFPVTTTPISSS